MALTALKIEGQPMVAITDQVDEILMVKLYMASADFKPKSQSSDFLREETEEEWHKKLRKDATERGHFVKEYSTNPEWNEGYVPNEEQECGINHCDDSREKDCE